MLQLQVVYSEDGDVYPACAREEFKSSTIYRQFLNIYA